MCDNPVDASQVTIVNQSGVHPVWIRFCICHSNQDEDQLLAVGLYPAMYRHIKSAFTFQVLDDFCLENLECKMSAYHYFKKLRRVTSPFFPTAVLACLPS